MGIGPSKDPFRVRVTAVTASDLSGSINKLVQIVGSNTVQAVATGTNGQSLCGVLESVDNSGTGVAADVCIFGKTKAVAGAAIIAGESFVAAVNNTNPGYVYPYSSAAAYGATGTVYITGIALETAAAASQVIDVLINPQEATLS